MGPILDPPEFTHEGRGTFCRSSRSRQQIGQGSPYEDLELPAMKLRAVQPLTRGERILLFQ
eukprot:2782640-Pyramimonas_sp.AAC.1